MARGPWIRRTAGFVELHVGENHQQFRHVVRHHTMLGRHLQNPIKDSLVVGVEAPRHGLDPFGSVPQ